MIPIYSSKILTIPQNEERYISFSKHIHVDEDEEKKKKFVQLRFLDSLRFISDSIDSLSQKLTKEQFTETKKYFPDIEYLKRGVFPYKYIDSVERYNEKQLPAKEAFYNDLRKEHITEDNYSYANNVWEKLNCKTLGEYSDLYMKFDVLLLGDIFENFRDVSINTYQLDPCWYFTTQG